MRPRKGQDVVPYVVQFAMPLDLEPLLARLGVVRQSALGGTEHLHRPMLVYHIDDPRGVEPPNPEHAGHDRDDFALADRRGGEH
jgi:hypothetical protein